MPVSTTPGTPIDINTLILLAYKRAGLLPVEATTAGANMTAKLGHGRQLLDLILDGLAVEGFVARTMAFYDLTIVAGTSSYTMPSTILDVFEDAMFIPDDNADTLHTQGELVCKQMDMATYQTLTNKGSESTRPQLYVALRDGADVVLRFWPVPSEAGTMRVKTVRLLGGNSDGSLNPDLGRYWYDALVWMLAHYLAVDSSMPPETVAALASTAEMKKKACVRYSFEHTGTQALVSYPTQWCG